MNTLRTLAGAALVAALVILVWAAPASSITPPNPEGDANCDKVTNSIDAALILQMDAGLIDTVPCRGVADISFDGAINSLDAAIILQLEAGLLARCPAGQSQGLIAKLTTNGTTFSQGEAVSMTLSIINCGSKPVSRGYSSSQLFDFDVREASGSKVWHWSHDRVFLAVISGRTFQPGEPVAYAAVWNQQTNNGEQVAPGSYELLAYDVGCGRPPARQCDLGVTLAFEIWAPPQ